jgi:signal transduction histidine kinase/ligand-binding sensor domain-containing protein
MEHGPFGCHWRLCWIFFAVFFLWATVAVVGQSVTPSSHPNDSVPNAVISPLPVKMLLTDGRDIRFKKLNGSEGLSQTRVSSAVQDNLGFMWFPTQYGLNRYDSYKFKVFRHEPGNEHSLSCVYIHSLIKDRAGTLWVGCDSVVDKFDPVSETFTHYPIHTEQNTGSAGAVVHMSQDHFGSLWLATPTGLYKLVPSTGSVTRYTHDPSKPWSLSSNLISTMDEDRIGELWVASSGGLDRFDRGTGRVTLHIPLAGFRNEFSFHEDKFGTFWVARASPSCPLAIFDRQTTTVHCYAVYEGDRTTVAMPVFSMLESRDGTMWFATIGAGVLRYNRTNGTLTRYKNDPADSESLGSNNVLSLYEDREGEIWACMHDVKPNVFAEKPSAFQSFTPQRRTLGGALVTTIFEDSDRILWIGTAGALNRIDRKTGHDDVAPASDAKSDILSIIEDRSGALVAGTYRDGLQKVDRKTGLLTPYARDPHTPSNQSESPIVRLLIDHSGVLWATTWSGLGRFDPSTGNFVRFRPETHSATDYYDLKQDTRGGMWIGGDSGLQYYEPQTNHFTTYKHDPDDPQSLADNRVNSVYPTRSGEIWVGTQNGLDKLDEKTGKFQAYYTKDGLSGNVVSCILEDERGQLWMGTNNGVSTLDPKSLKFTTYSAADGLPGQDLTGWSSCYKSSDGEMFFGGFGGAVAFYPGRVQDAPYVPVSVLTDFRLSGIEVPIGNNSPLDRSISYTDSLTLTSKQNIFSIEFSALSYVNSPADRYRYKLEGLDTNWHEVDSTARTASYTTLPKGNYTLRVQSATGRGAWNDPGLSLHVKILPHWWNTWWFSAIYTTTGVLLLWFGYRFRLHEITRQHDIRLEERLNERNRIARELHDTLLQGFYGLMLQFQAVLKTLQHDEPAYKKMEQVMARADQVLLEGRQSVRGLRDEVTSGDDLRVLLMHCGEQLAQDYAIPFTLSVLGEPPSIDPTICREMYYIGREAISNAFQHSQAAKIEATISYGESVMALMVRDNGVGIEPDVLNRGRIGHWGFPGMRERAESIGAEFSIRSHVGSGTEVSLTVPIRLVEAVRRKESLWRRIWIFAKQPSVPS